MNYWFRRGKPRGNLGKCSSSFYLQNSYNADVAVLHNVITAAFELR